ncbi:hypothetical protein LOTGIDRAFT_153880 [Lottia gigantea]|uniref:Fibronectin type-III domain-containing protein n=1 Tax=Lottia gigantea TaxID=225164 RepID=V3ZJI7_LOTGI|nr:hypothetical protein LOTGIDRAFT_153880 [Lottia gigantea]ESO91438.1 hypothetical protein LOTGIDRAFT_153880 [Lottia gigantea]
MGNGASTETGNIIVENPQNPGSQQLRSRNTTPSNMASKARKTPTPQKSRDSSFNEEKGRDIDGSFDGIVIHVAQSGFSENQIEVREGQSIQFLWEDKSSKLSLLQVVHDGEKLRPVIGGYQSNPEDCDGLFRQQFNLEGEYKFALSGMRCTPLNVIVKKRSDYDARVTDNGFQPEIINIDIGHSVKWWWKNCSVPHTIQEITYIMDRGCFQKQSVTPSMVATVTGAYKHTFQRSGIYYFLSESGQEVGKTHLCVVQVHDTCREYKLEVLDSSFQPMILLIEEGDRVWFHWDKNKCKKSHSVYEIEAPPLGYSDDEPYIPTKDGFRWSAPSKQGLLSHQFHKTGVFYFSDQNFDEAAEYIGSVIVKPKQKEHVIQLTRDGFSAELSYISTGDRIWWKWDGETVTNFIDNLLIIEDDKCLNPATNNRTSEPISEDLYHMLDEESASLITMSGLATCQFTTIGVYHYRIAETDENINTCSVIVNPGSKNNTVHLTDDGFEPKVVTIRPNDRVWWVWQGCKKQHNIIQVTHQGSYVEKGFSSGLTRDSPSAYVHQFIMPGVYYFISANLPKLFGAVVVSSQPQVHEVKVNVKELIPDPITIQLNDIVCWVFRQPQKHAILDVKSNESLHGSLFSPRRCHGLAVTTCGISHYNSLSFHYGKLASKEEKISSSVICDERNDNAVVRVDKHGFHPTKVYLSKGHSVLWNWKGTNEEHNIIHVNSPNSDQPLNVIEGIKSFNSGKLLRNNSFLYTFDDEGVYTVASQGAPGYSCNIYIKSHANRSSQPMIVEGNGGIVDKNHCVELYCDTPESDIYYTTDSSPPSLASSKTKDIYYTTDSSPPSLASSKTKKYDKKNGVILSRKGYCFIRAISVAESCMVSHTFTSNRFTVQSHDNDDDDNESDVEVEVVNENIQNSAKSNSSDWDWLNCAPQIKGCFTGPGEMELFWEQAAEANRHLIKGYSVLLNGVSYCPLFPAHNNSLNITGLAGNRFYQIFVEVYSKTNNRPLKSNVLNLRCPIKTNEGGPVISLEIPDKKDSISIVWMAIDSPDCQIEGYSVYINDQQCGPKLVPDPNSNRCKVIIGSCSYDIPYKIFVDAIVSGTGETKMSNVIEMQLPLDTSGITLPPQNERDNDEEIYCEYVEIHEGSGYLPQMDDEKNTKEEVIDMNYSKGIEPLSEKKRSMKTYASMDTYSKAFLEKKSNNIDQSRQEFFIEDDLKRNFTAPRQSQKSFYAVAKFMMNFIRAQKRLQVFKKGPKKLPLNWGVLKNVFHKTVQLHGHVEVGKNIPELDPEPEEEVKVKPSKRLPLNKLKRFVNVKQQLSRVVKPSQQQPTPEVQKNPSYTETKFELPKQNSFSRSETETRHLMPRQNSQSRSDHSETRLQLPRQHSQGYQSDRRLQLPRQSSQGYSDSSDRGLNMPRQMSQSHSDYSETRFELPRQHSHNPSEYAQRSREGFAKMRNVRSEDERRYHQHDPRKHTSHNRTSFDYYQDDIEEVSFDSEFDDSTDRSYRVVERAEDSGQFGEQSRGPGRHGKTGNYFHDLYERQLEVDYDTPRRRMHHDLEQTDSEIYHYDSLYGRKPEHTQKIIKDNFPYKDEIGIYPPQLNYYDRKVLPPKEYGGMLDRYLECYQQMPPEDQSTFTEDQYLQGKSDEKGGKKRPGNTFHIDSMESESETETEDSDVASDDDNNLEQNIVILDAASNRTHDTVHSKSKKKHRRRKDKPKRKRKHFSPRKASYVDVDDDDDEDYADGGRQGNEHQRRHGKRKSGRTTAIVEVQQTVELDVQDSRFGDNNQEITEQKRLAVPVSSSANMLPVGEGEFILGDGDGILPAPSIMVESRGKRGVRVVWELPESPDPNYKLILYCVNVVGYKFSKDINSDISFECNLVEKGEQVRGVQHCWNVQGEEKCNIKGLLPSLTYRIYVIANYTHLHGDEACEIQTTSSVLYYTTMGPPKPPTTLVKSVDFYQATMEWDPPSIVHPGVKIKGYQLYVDNKPLGDVRNSDVRQMVINNMIPGKTISVHVIAVTSRASQESDPSKTIYLSCPRRPPSPTITQQPSFKQGCVLIAWDKPKESTSSNIEQISAYCVYIDGIWHGEVKANKISDKQGYQFFLTDLSPEQCYDVSVKSVCGQRDVDKETQHVYCLSDSPMSNIVTVRAPAAPKSPTLRLEGLHPDGIDVTWQVPQQFGDASISGYQMLKDNKLYGAVIPPDVNSLKIKDMSLGEKVNLQLIALTEHPVGKTDGSLAGDKDSGLGGSTIPDDKRDIFMGERYSGCKPGPKLSIHYTGLVQAPTEVRCEKVTGHSALIVWNKENGSKPHFVGAENYQVTWWPGSKPQDDINSDSTSDDHLIITNLKPSTCYTIVVEARKMEKYTDIDESLYDRETSDGLNSFILTAKSKHISLTTASPPNPPRNLGVKATTCNSLQVIWDPPEEHGAEVIGIRIECVAADEQDQHFVTVDLMPDTKCTDINTLHEKKDYNVRVIAVTDEYFDRLPDKHPLKKSRTLPRDVLVSTEDSVWLPSSSILAKTAGTEAPANLKITESSRTSLTLTWTPPIIYGSNKLLGQIIRWSDVKRNKGEHGMIIANHVSVLPTEDRIKLDDLCPGAQYKIVVEAVVSIKTSLEREKSGSGIEQYRRTAHVMSKPLLARTRAPIEPPRLLLTSFDKNQGYLYWEKPPLLSVIGKDDEGKPKYLRRYLEGYKLEINGKLQCYLGPSAQTCTLTKCKPGKAYSVVLVAVTCTEESKKTRKQKLKGFFKNVDPQDIDYAAILNDDENLDESPSEPLEICLPRDQEGFLSSLQAVYKNKGSEESDGVGVAHLKWKIQGRTNLIKQFRVIWYCVEDRIIQTKYITSDRHDCSIPVTKIKTLYNFTVEPTYYTDVISQTIQDVQIMIPGPPDAPDIYLRSVDTEEFIIEWGEPRVFGGVKVKGYQVYMNDKKVGAELSNSHRKAVIPCRPNRIYRINLVALSANSQYSDSLKSNTLLINTSTNQHQTGDVVTIDDWASTTDDSDIPVKITKVLDTGIHLDWSTYYPSEEVAYYKVQWSSVAQPTQREVQLSAKDTNCVINKCLPGTNHFVRLVAFDSGGQIWEKSRQMTIQTSAPPDAPILSIRASNFRYLAIQWEKPSEYGDAIIAGYKVFVNGIVEAHLAADQLSYTFTNGRWCHEYSFQVQAMTSDEKMNSRVSDQLIVTWPGAKSPAIHRIPSVSSSTLRVGWEDPHLTDGIKVKHFKLCCIEEDTEKLVQSVGPIHPKTREAEFNHLKKGSYSVYLETHLYGTGDVVRSDTIRMQPSLSPDAPQIAVTMVGLEERRQLEKLTCDLVNKRDRLIRAVGHKLKRIGALSHPVKAEKDEDIIIGAHTLTRVEELLEECFLGLEQYIGQLIAYVSWQCPQSNPDMCVSGYKVLIDGKQYGNALHAGVKTVKVKLDLSEPSYKLTMVAMTDKPQGCSDESNMVELLTSPFKPFSFYCYHGIHNKTAKWPNPGCCKFEDSTSYERQVAKKLANQGLLQKHVPPPVCNILDIFDGDFKPFMSTHKPQFPTVVLFWTPWCEASKKIFDHFIRFAKSSNSEASFIGVTCGISGIQATNRKYLADLLTAKGWRDDNCVWHVTSECSSSRTRNDIIYNSSGRDIDINEEERDKQMDLTELLGVVGVPTMFIIHPQGYMAWHGRYCAYDYTSFNGFMKHTLNEVIHQPCPVSNCDCCNNNMSIDEEALGFLAHEPKNSTAKNVRIAFDDSALLSIHGGRNMSPTRDDTSSGSDRIFIRHKPAYKKSNSRISVDQRPISASSLPVQYHRSPYLAHVTGSSPKQSRFSARPSSARKSNY